MRGRERATGGGRRGSRERDRNGKEQRGRRGRKGGRETDRAPQPLVAGAGVPGLRALGMPPTRPDPEGHCPRQLPRLPLPAWPALVGGLCHTQDLTRDLRVAFQRPTDPRPTLNPSLHGELRHTTAFEGGLQHRIHWVGFQDMPKRHPSLHMMISRSQATAGRNRPTNFAEFDPNMPLEGNAEVGGLKRYAKGTSKFRVPRTTSPDKDEAARHPPNLSSTARNSILP